MQAFCQSAKKLNKQLWVELALEEQKQDSVYVLFQRSKREYDSVRNVIMEKVTFLSREESITNRLAADFAEVRGQLQQLGTNPSFLVDEITFANIGIPNYKELTAPMKDAFDKDLKFHKVSNSFNYDMDSKPKELNPVLIQKLEEYDDHSKMNEVTWDRVVRNTKQLRGLFPKLDSMSRVYELMSNELRVKGGKLRNKLDELRGDYIEKGPDGFPEAYRRVFYDAFPPPASETKEEAMKNNHSELAERLDEVAPVLAEPESRIYEDLDVEEYAVFPGGSNKMWEFISMNLRYPEKIREELIEDRVVLRVVVSETGNISDIRVIRSFPDCKECDLEAIRVIKLMPNWIPARVNGKPVKSYGRLSVQFKW
jgi:TonB family protein